MKSGILLFFSLIAFALSLGVWINLGIASWTLALLGVGILFISVEITLLPGTLFCGIIGLFFLCAGFYGAWSQQLFHRYLSEILLSISSEIVGLALFFYVLRSSQEIQNRLVLKESSPTNGLQESTTPRSLLGKQGICVTELRPAGKIKLDEILYDVVSTGDFIPRESKVQIVDVSSNRLMVERIED